MKKILSVILALSMCLTLGVMLIACGHEHTWDTVWDTDETYHWHVCTGEECTEVSDKAEHDWDEGKITSKPTATANGKKTFVCKVCGEAKYEPVFAKTEVTAAEWAAAMKLDAENFSILAELVMTDGEEREEMTQTIKKNGAIMQTTYVEGESDTAENEYIAKEGDKYYAYEVEGSDPATREEITKDEYDEGMAYFGAYLGEIFQFADFTYDKTEKAYTAAEVTVGEGEYAQKFTNVSIKFVDNQLASVAYTQSYTATMTVVTTMVVEYGNVPAIILPVIDAAA